MKQQLGIIYPWLDATFDKSTKSEGSISLDISDLPRLKSLQNNEYVTISIEYSLAQTGRATERLLTGNAKVLLNFDCQRCLAPFDYEHEINFSFLIIRSKIEEKNTQSSNKSIDDILFCNESLDLKEIVEDELIISLPIIMKHKEDSPECKRLVEQDKKTISKEQYHPFKNLKNLLDD